MTCSPPRLTSNAAARGAVVRPGDFARAVEAQREAADGHGVADVHPHVALGLVALHHRHADDEHRDAEMRDDHSPVAPRLARELRDDAAAHAAAALPHVDDRRRDDPRREQQAEAHHRRPLAGDERQHQRGDEAHDERPLEPLPQVGQGRLLPARERADAHQEDERRHQRNEHGVEVRRADRDLAEVQRIEEQRVERAEQHRARGGDQQHVVREQHRFARHGVEAAAAADLRRAQRRTAPASRR